MHFKSILFFLTVVMAGLTQAQAQPPQVAVKPQAQTAAKPQAKAQTQARAAQMAAADRPGFFRRTWNSVF